MRIELFTGEGLFNIYTECVIEERTFSFIRFTGKDHFGNVREISSNTTFIVHHEPSKKK